MVPIRNRAMTELPKTIQTSLPSSVSPVSQIWMLFASGNSVEVYANSYPPLPASVRPINGYMVSDCDGDCEEAAIRAVEIAWQVVTRQGKKLQPQVLGFDLKGRVPGRQVVGASGGLALAIAAWRKMAGERSGPVAATGILQSTDLDAPIMKVAGIVEKLEAAVQLVPAKGLVLYPEANRFEIPKELEKKFHERSIRLHGVKNISDAFSHLQVGILVKKPKKTVSRKWLYASTCALLLGVFISAGYFWMAGSQETPEQPILEKPTDELSKEVLPSINQESKLTTKKEEEKKDAAPAEKPSLAPEDKDDSVQLSKGFN